MSYEIISGLADILCNDAQSGVKAVYIASPENVQTITVVAGEVTALTMVATKKFYEFRVRPGTANFTQDIKVNASGGTSGREPKITMYFSEMTAAKNEIISKVIKGRVYAIVLDNNGRYWFAGHTNFLDTADGGVAETGAAFNTNQGYTITLTGNEKEFAPEIDALVVAPAIA